jgi:hypothetical protein
MDRQALATVRSRFTASLGIKANGIGRGEQLGHVQIETGLGKRGIDEASLNAEVLIQSRQLFIISYLTQCARSRRVLLLREINLRTSLQIDCGRTPKHKTATLSEHRGEQPP